MRRVGAALASILVLLALVAAVTLNFGPGPLAGGGPYTLSDQDAETATRQVSAAFDSIQNVWRQRFGKSGYAAPKVTFTTGVTVSPCSDGQPATGPFYCPERLEAVFDLTFFGALNARLRRNGDLGTALVVAMISAAAVQDELGLLDDADAARRRARTSAESKAVDEALAAQADCLAGVWAALARDSLGPVPDGFYEQLIGLARNVMDDQAPAAPESSTRLDPFRAASRTTRQADFARGYAAADPKVCLPQEVAAR